MKINKSLKILFALNSVFVFAGSLFGPLYALYVQQIDNKIISISISWTVFMISSTVFTYFTSKYGDKIKEQEYILAAGFFVRGLSWIGYIFVFDLWSLVTLQIFLGLGEALGTPAWNAIFAKHLDRGSEIADYSKWNIVNNLMVAVATLIGGVFVSYFGFKIMFIIMSLLAFVSFTGVIVTPKDEL